VECLCLFFHHRVAQNKCVCVCVCSWTQRTVRWRCWRRRAAASAKIQHLRSPIPHTSWLRAPRTRRLSTVITIIITTRTRKCDRSPSRRSRAPTTIACRRPSARPAETGSRRRRGPSDRRQGRGSHHRKPGVGRICPTGCHQWTASRCRRGM